MASPIPLDDPVTSTTLSLNRSTAGAYAGGRGGGWGARRVHWQHGRVDPTGDQPRALADVLAVVPRGPALAVVAHPDDESFGLGAVLAALVADGRPVRVLCFTHGEASTLGAAEDLGETRARELRSAGDALGVERVHLLPHADGGLELVPGTEVDDLVEADLGDATLVVVFEPSGVTGHPDHRAATAAGHRVARRRGLPVLEWGVAPAVAAGLNDALGTTFVAFDPPGTTDVVVDRVAQRAAIACHASQAHHNPAVGMRLELEHDVERVRLRLPTSEEP